MYFILIGIMALVIVCGLIAWYFGDRIYRLRKECKELQKLKDGLRKDCEENAEDVKKLDAKIINLCRDISEYDAKKNEAISRANEARDATERLLASEQERLRAELKVEQQHIENEFKEKERALEEQFDFKKKQFAEDFETLLGFFHDEVAIAQEEVNDFQAKRAAINEAIAREKELQENEAFYSIDVSLNDQEDISVLQSMDLHMHNRDVIPKLIWELFIRRPCQEMIKRVTGGKKISGIYKITYKKTGEAYIGKTVDITTRWQNHVKTAIGLEAAARATLHNRLAKDGLWNYTFEILEEVDKDHLSAREGYYIELYGTKSQLNMKSGETNGTK